MGKKLKLKSKSKSKSRSKSIQKIKRHLNETFGGDDDNKYGIQQQGQTTPMMTPMHKILRNAFGQSDTMAKYGGLYSTVATPVQQKKVQICSRRLRDISNFTSSSESSYDSLDNERYIKKQAAGLSPWQREIVRKVLPKNMR